MGDTNFPNGLTVDSGHEGNLYPSVTASGKRTAHGTAVVPSGGSGTAFATGLTTVEFAVASPYLGAASVAAFAGVGAAVGSGGTVTLRGISGAGTASTANGTATWFAIGT